MLLPTAESTGHWASKRRTSRIDPGSAPYGGSTTDGEFFAPVTAQWWATPSLRPEQRLMRAVLAEALADLNVVGGVVRPHLNIKRRQGVLAWFVSHDRSWPCSFENICDAIDLDPDRMRAALGRLGHSMAG